MRLLLLPLILLCASAWCEAVYPPKVPIRLYGSDQMETGSCRAESEVAALEQAFAERNYPVQFSTFHRHAYNYAANPVKPDGIAQAYEGNDSAVLSAGSAFWPLYMWPEDGSGYARFDDRVRPSLQWAAVAVPGFPNLSIVAHGWTFQRPPSGSVWSNAAVFNLNSIKDLVRRRIPVTIGVHASLFYHMDRGTGLLNAPYTRAWLPKDLNTFVYDRDLGLDHSVAVVGFDDGLYGGQGALIVRNSWNDFREINMCEVAAHSKNPAVLESLKSMRYKISSDNLPGYFALPYSYIQDLIAFPAFDGGSGGIDSGTYFDVDYNQVYQAYASGQAETQVYSVPFVCDRRELDKLVQDFDHIRAGNDQAALLQMLMMQVLKQPRWPIEIARLPVNRKLAADRVESLAEGKMWSYYCADSPGTDRFPNVKEIHDPLFQNLLEQFRQGGETSVSVWYRFFNWASCQKNRGELCL